MNDGNLLVTAVIGLAAYGGFELLRRLSRLLMERRNARYLDPSETYVHLTPGGSAELLEGGERFWARPESDLDRVGQGWLITEFECSSDWPNWEMHPEAEEFVYLLSGAAVLLLEQPGGLQEVPLSGRGAVIVPKGIWHTAKVSQPSRMLFVTMGRGTQHRAT